MANKEKLLPCPFCGKKPHYVPADYVNDIGEPWPFAECDPCHVGAPVEFWNTRAAQPVAVQTTGSDYLDFKLALNGMGEQKQPVAVSGMPEPVGYRCRFHKEPEHWMVEWKPLPANTNPAAEYQLLYPADAYAPALAELAALRGEVDRLNQFCEAAAQYYLKEKETLRADKAKLVELIRRSAKCLNGRGAEALKSDIEAALANEVPNGSVR